MARFVALFVAAFVAAAAPPTALASHDGNNAAELSAPGDPGATGKAIVNYSEGRGDFNGTITVRNLAPPGVTYSFFVRFQSPGLPIEDTLICSGEANQQGTFTCQAQHLTLGRFTRAVVLDTRGDVVAAGAFERRGNCRDPEQFMSQCDAPGHNRRRPDRSLPRAAARAARGSDRWMV